MTVEPEDVLTEIEERGINFLRLQFTDITGLIKSVSVPAAQVEKAFDEGIWFDGSSIDGFVRIQESDMRLTPDPDTFTVIPFENEGDPGSTARMICDVTHPDGSAFLGDPRHALHRAIARADEMGFEFNAGPEPEFFVFERDDGRATTRTHDYGGYFDLAPKDLASDLRRDVILCLREMGFDVEASHHEVAEGQHEIDFKYDDALTTADNIATFRLVVRSVAANHDLHATFMPKPIAGINGSGMHTHMSLFDEDDTNAFHDPTDEFDLSETARSFMAGILEHAPAITAVTNPTVNSYKRLVPGYEAPVYVAWSDVNRSAQIRKPAARKPEGTRFELRSPDPSCNPYLHLAVCLRAGLDGVEKGLEAPEPVRENIYEFTDEKREEYGIDVLPGSLDEAVDALEEDPVVQSALGDHIRRRFIDAKRQEYNRYRASVGDWELDRYLETF